MRVFVTGATGFVGSAVVQEPIEAGHQVLGLARSDAGAKSLAAAGADVLRGVLEDTSCLKSGAAAADAVIHLGFNHDFSDFLKNCETDKQAIEAIGSVLSGSDKPFIVTSGLAGLAAAPGELATEESSIPPNFPMPRVSEQTALSLLPKSVRVSVVRLSQIHDTTKQGLITFAIATAREKGVLPMLATERTVGRPRTSMMLAAFTGSRWKSLKLARNGMRLPKIAFGCAILRKSSVKA